MSDEKRVEELTNEITSKTYADDFTAKVIADIILARESALRAEPTDGYLDMLMPKVFSLRKHGFPVSLDPKLFDREVELFVRFKKPPPLRNWVA